MGNFATADVCRLLLRTYLILHSYSVWICVHVYRSTFAHFSSVSLLWCLMSVFTVLAFFWFSASEMTYIVSCGGVERDLRPLNIGLVSAWQRAQDRERWKRTVETATLQDGECSWWWWWWGVKLYSLTHPLSFYWWFLNYFFYISFNILLCGYYLYDVYHKYINKQHTYTIMTCLESPVGDGVRVLTCLRSFDNSHFELIPRRRRQIVEHHMLLPGDRRQSTSERQNRLVVNVVVAWVVSRLADRSVYPPQQHGRRWHDCASEVRRRCKRQSIHDITSCKSSSPTTTSHSCTALNSVNCNWLSTKNKHRTTRSQHYSRRNPYS